MQAIQRVVLLLFTVGSVLAIFEKRIKAAA
jgi:hypothetical protein